MFCIIRKIKRFLKGYRTSEYKPRQAGVYKVTKEGQGYRVEDLTRIPCDICGIKIPKGSEFDLCDECYAEHAIKLCEHCHGSTHVTELRNGVCQHCE